MTRSRSLSPHAKMVLSVLLNARGAWSYGYQLARLADVKSGTLYPLLIRLESQGYLEAEWQPPSDSGRPPRHAYRLTTTGVRLAQANPPVKPAEKRPYRPEAAI